MSYLLRLAKTNGYADVGWIMRLAKIEHRQRGKGAVVFQPKNYLAGLARLVGTDTGALSHMLYPPVNPSGEKDAVLFYGAALGKHMISTAGSRICPECLGEFGYRRGIWHCALVTACPFHNCLLLDRCPGCGRAPVYHNCEVVLCACEHDLRAVRTRRVPADEAVLSAWTHDLCGMPTPGGAVRTSNPLQDLNLTQLAALMAFMLGQQDGRLAVTRMHMRQCGVAELHAELMAVRCTFDNFPDNYLPYLGRRQLEQRERNLQPSRRRPYGLEYCVGNFYRGVYDLQESAFDFLRVGFEKFWYGG